MFGPDGSAENDPRTPPSFSCMTSSTSFLNFPLFKKYRIPRPMRISSRNSYLSLCEDVQTTSDDGLVATKLPMSSCPWPIGRGISLTDEPLDSAHN